MRNWGPVSLHPAAHLFFNPHDEIGRLANIVESLAAIKELLFALVLVTYLLWQRWKRLQQKEHQVRLAAEKERLDRFLEKTFRIEESQMQTTDPAELKEFLDQVTRIKLDALMELTHEELRGDQSFQIFLIQCANLINKIQFKIMQNSPVGGRP